MSYDNLESEMKEKINQLSAKTEFFLRDIISDPPALLGRWLYEGVESKEITGVEFIGIEGGVDKYRKL